MSLLLERMSRWQSIHAGTHDDKEFVSVKIEYINTMMSLDNKDVQF